MSFKVIAEHLGVDIPNDNVEEEKDIEFIPDEESIGNVVVMNETTETSPIEEMFGQEEKIGHIEEDYLFARQKLKSIITQGEKSLTGLLSMIEEDPSARSYEVAGTMLKTLSDITTQFFELQKKNKDLHQTSLAGLGAKPPNMQIQQGVVFTGNSADMLKILKQKREEKKEE